MDVSYSNMSTSNAEKGFQMGKLNAISVARMLAEAKYEPGEDGILKIKERVYGNIVQYLITEGYPESDFNVSDLVYMYHRHSYTLEFHTQDGRRVRLRREREIISTDGETGEFVVCCGPGSCGRGSVCPHG